MKSKESLISEIDAKGQKLQINMKDGAIIKCPQSLEKFCYKKRPSWRPGRPVSLSGPPEVSSPDLTPQRPGLQVEPCEQTLKKNEKLPKENLKTVLLGPALVTLILCVFPKMLRHF